LICILHQALLVAAAVAAAALLICLLHQQLGAQWFHGGPSSNAVLTYARSLKNPSIAITSTGAQQQQQFTASAAAPGSLSMQKQQIARLACPAAMWCFVGSAERVASSQLACVQRARSRDNSMSHPIACMCACRKQ
jgi:hypothetical protein